MLKHKLKSYLPNEVRDWVFAIRMHKNAHGRYPRLLRPRTLNECIVRRKLFAREPLFRTFADKYAVRQYVADRVSPDILPKLYWWRATRSGSALMSYLPVSSSSQHTDRAGCV